MQNWKGERGSFAARAWVESLPNTQMTSGMMFLL